VSTLTAFALAVEIGNWNRFTGNTIGSFVGLVPVASSRVVYESVLITRIGVS
jgi:transposase